jgi:ATP-dependent 26S proteasome regulatory subunit
MTPTLNQRITNYFKAGYSGLYLVSHEEDRIEALLAEVATGAAAHLYGWSCTKGLDHIIVREGEARGVLKDMESIDDLLKAIAGGAVEKESFVLLRDMHGWYADANPMLTRLLRDALIYGKAHGITLVVSGCEFNVPPEVSKSFVRLDFELPDRPTMGRIIKAYCAIAQKPEPVGAAMEVALDAAAGMTTTEAEDAVSLSLTEEGMLCASVIYREKIQVIKKHGILELVETRIKPEDIGGLDLLKVDLHSKRNLFTEAARKYGLPSPRGIFAVGQPGSGKSLLAQATGSIFGVPLLKLEAGRLFGSLVGQSEANWRSTFAMARAVAPCVLWIDEVDGLFAGSASSGTTDGGTTSRVIKTILQDMQFNSEGIFFVFTANDIEHCPDPLIDRLDVWSVDLPNAEERKAIWSIHIAKRKRNPELFDLDTLSSVTDGFSGRQIEQVWLKAMTAAFNEGREPELIDATTAAASVIPTSKTMAEVIDARRRRLQGRATPASSPLVATTKATTQRRLAA